MPRFMVTRTLPPMSAEQMKNVARNIVKACDDVGGMKWIRSDFTADGGHSFCEFEAQDAFQCRKHAAIAGLPVDDVVALGPEVGPTPL